jgi:hypothetical protein
VSRTIRLTETLNDVIGQVARRAEMSDPSRLQKTFVEVEQITTGLRAIDHGILYGRRGTGKTHAFTHLTQELDQKNDLPLLLDLRRIGSNGGLYSDQDEDFSLRASQLLIDVIEDIHDHLLGVAMDDDRFSGLLESLDKLGEAATDIRVDGPVETVDEDETEAKADHQGGWDLTGKAPGNITAGIRSTKSTAKSNRKKQTQRRSGVELPKLRFGQLSRAIEGVARSIAPARIWILLDEWSSLPIDLQPVLADMLKRAFFTVPGVTIKIGAIERRSRFILRRSDANYIGIELGADTGATLNLDEHLIDVDDQRFTVDFYGRLIQKHLQVTATEVDMSWNIGVADLKRSTFAGDAFLWLVRAAEGIPRDVINILGLAAGYARSRKIQDKDIRRAARTYYLQDKEKGIIGNRPAERMWDTLQREVVAYKRSRTFLLRRTREQMPLAILDLYDARLIHLLKQGLNTASKPGVMYDGYAVDFGSCVTILEDMELDAAWSKSKYPWEYASREAEVFLSDRFDEGVVFTPR